jgi:hypothetical protein
LQGKKLVGCCARRGARYTLFSERDVRFFTFVAEEEIVL